MRRKRNESLISAGVWGVIIAGKSQLGGRGLGTLERQGQRGEEQEEAGIFLTAGS